MSKIANTLQPPYYAVIFTSLRSKNDSGYDEMAHKMVKLAEQQPGFLGLESAKENISITVSYWNNLTSIKQWKANVNHIEAQKSGHTTWYDSFKVRISKVDRDYGI